MRAFQDEVEAYVAYVQERVTSATAIAERMRDENDFEDLGSMTDLLIEARGHLGGQVLHTAEYELDHCR